MRNLENGFTMNKIIILLSVVLIFSFGHSKAQESYLKNRWNIKASYAPYPIGGLMFTGSSPKGKVMTTADFRLESNYGVLNFLEVGTYIGYARYKMLFFIPQGQPDEYGSLNGYSKDGNFLSYGVNANLHIFPFFIKQPNFRFDLYLTAKYGGRSSLTSDIKNAMNSNTYKYSHEWGVGLGFAFYMFKNVGIFAEYSIGKYYLGNEKTFFSAFFPNNSTVRVGITTKFKPKKK